MTEMAIERRDFANEQLTIGNIELIRTGRRGRPRLNISEEERAKRANERKKKYNAENPEKYKEVYRRTTEKNRDKINDKQKERQRLIRAQTKALRLSIEQSSRETENILN
jgi:hypothetical protein